MLVMMLRTVTLRRALPLVLVAHDLLGRSCPARARRSSSQPQRGRRPRDPDRAAAGRAARRRPRTAAPLERARDAGVGLGGAFARRRAAGRRARRLPARAARPAVICSASAPQVLDQHDAQRDRDGPQLADRQRLDALIGAHEAAQHLGIEAAVGVGDEGPGDAEHARIAGERSVQRASAAAGNSRAAGRRGFRGSALRRDDSCRAAIRPPGDARPLFDCRGARTIGGEQRRRIVVKPRDASGSTGTAGDGLRAARLRACSSRRSTLKSSSRTGAASLQGETTLSRPRARSMSLFTKTFPIDERSRSR